MSGKGSGMRIMIHSNVPWAPTGYGQQTAQLATRLQAAGHDVAIAANWGLMGSVLSWGDGIPVYPAAETFEKVRDDLPHWVRHFGGGDPQSVLVLTLADVYVMTDPRLADMRVASWTPVDHKPLPPRVAEYFNRTGARPIAMSRFGLEELEKADYEALYVPHGVDTNVFRPHPDRAELRRALRLPEDAFVVGMVANNQGTHPPRKAFPQVFEAFAELHSRHPESLLYVHAEMVGRNKGINLYALARIFGIESAIGVSDQTAIRMDGYGPERMAAMYAAFDVLVNPSYGEGFGIPIVEAQACGTPVIVTEWTAMTELCGSGWLVGGERLYDAGHGAFYKTPSIEEIAAALVDAHGKHGDMDVRQKAREFALQYDADRVFTEQWVPVLEECSKPREVAALNGRVPVSKLQAVEA